MVHLKYMPDNDTPLTSEDSIRHCRSATSSSEISFLVQEHIDDNIGTNVYVGDEIHVNTNIQFRNMCHCILCGTIVLKIILKKQDPLTAMTHWFRKVEFFITMKK